MAQIAKSDIMVGSNRSVGRVSVDAGMIRAEGGPLEPRLVIPVTIEMHNRPAEQMLALTYLIGHLHIGDANNPSTQVGWPARMEFIPGFHARSLPEGKSEHYAELRCQMTPISVERLESSRHGGSDSPFELQLRCEGAVAWIRTTWGEMQPSHGRAGTVDAADPFHMQFGLHSQLSYLWTVKIDTLRIQVEPSAWIANVLPGLGIDRLRLLEVAFPPTLPGGANSAKAFDDALRAFNTRHYEECIGKCRAIVAAWNKKLRATKAQPIGVIVAVGHGWSSEDARIAWLNGIWHALIDMSNAAHHQESRAERQGFSMHDAKLHLMMTAAVSEYLGALVL
jgi:hypothetical protein